MDQVNKAKLYESALSVYHSAQSILDNEEESTNNNDTETVKAESMEYLPMIEKQNNEQKIELTNDECKITDKNNINNDKYKKYLNISALNLYLPWLSLFLYLIDVFSDQILAINYATKNEWVYSSLTCIFVILPAFYLSIFVGKSWKQIIAKGWKWWCLLVPLVIFNLEPAIQYMKNFLTVKKYLKAKDNKDIKKQKKYYDKYISGHRNVSDLKYTESLMEALPQFTLQGYIILSNYETLKINAKLFLQMGSLTTSVVGLAVIIFVRHKVWLLDNGMSCTEFGRTLWTIGRFFSLVARTLSMTTSASLYPGFTFLFIGIHWLVAAIWRYISHLKQLGYIEPIFQGAADTLVARVDSIRSNITSHAVMLIEDIIMMTVWFCHVGYEYDNLKYILLSVVLSIDVVGCFADILYKIFNNTFTFKVEFE